MKKSFLLSICAVAALVSCQNDADVVAPIGQKGDATFQANILIDATRTSADVDANGKVSVLWSEDDAIAMFAKGSTENSELQIDGGEGTTTATFVGEITEGASGSYIAYYPYDEAIALEGTSMSVTFPDQQTYVEGSLASAPMLAVSESKSLSFKNLAALVCVTLTGDETIESISLSGNNGETLAGAATVNVSTGALALADDADKSVITLDCGDGITLDQEGVSFYFVVPAMDFEDGFTVVATTTEGEVMSKTSAADVTLEASKVYNYPALAFEASSAIVTNANFATALANAEEGKTLVFGEDITTTTSLTINEGKNITIDLNGKTWTATLDDHGLRNYGTLALANGKIKFESSYNATAPIANYGILKLNEIDIESNQYCVINRGTWDNTKTLQEQAEPNVELDIAGGTFTSSWTHPANHNTHVYAISCTDNAILNVADATVEGDGGIYVDCAYGNLKNVTASKYCTTGANGLYIACAEVNYKDCNFSDVFAYTTPAYTTTYGKTTVNGREYTSATTIE